MTQHTGAALEQILGDDPPPFAVLHRPESTGAGTLELLVGRVATVERVADLPVAAGPTGGGARHDLLALLPYRQIRERGFACVDDGTPLLALEVTEQARILVPEFAAAVPDAPARLSGERFDITDAEYADLVRRIVADEIGQGTGANFVIKRSFLATVEDFSTQVALAVFRRLLRHESGAYWTFLVHTGSRTLIGASPERHVSVAGGVATMNPISGTFRYPPSGASPAGLLGFLGDRKESDELYMVLDEELKMMGRVCAGGGRVVGPRLKLMAELAHTEYFIEGRAALGVRETLAETMFAPTVTGSPLESACRVIARHERGGRGYYSGALALIGREPDGTPLLDSAIVIRTADVDAGGNLRIDVGATLVRHSDPHAEAAETRVKAAAMLAAFRRTPGAEGGTPRRAPGGECAGHPEIRAALSRRNQGLGTFWLSDRRATPAAGPLAGRRVLVVDCEDTFTAMLRHQLAALGLSATVIRFDGEVNLAGHDLVVVGPGPGDPRDAGHPKIAAMRRITEQVLRAGIPLLSICLGHQVLCSVLGLDIVRRPVPNQGLRREIDLFGRVQPCGFYNTFAARSETDRWDTGTGSVAVCRDPDSGEIHAMRGPGFHSMQFHPESVLTENGVDILRDAITALLLPAEALTA